MQRVSLISVPSSFSLPRMNAGPQLGSGAGGKRDLVTSESSELQRRAASKKLVTLDWYCDFAMICASACPEPGTSQSCFGGPAAAKFLKLLSASATGSPWS